MAYPRFYHRIPKGFKEDATIHYSINISTKNRLVGKTHIKVDSRYWLPKVETTIEDERIIRTYVDENKAKNLGSWKVAKNKQDLIRDLGDKMNKKLIELKESIPIDEVKYELKKAVNVYVGKTKQKYINRKQKVFLSTNPNVDDVFDEYMESLKKKGKGETSIDAYARLKVLLIDFQEEINEELEYDHITNEFYDDFIEYLSTPNDFFRAGKPFGKNTQGTIIKRLKAVMNFGKTKEYHQKEEHKLFPIPEAPVHKIYLKQKELDALEDLTLSKELAAIRDYFLLCSYVGCRISDGLSFTSDNITEIEGIPVIDYTQKKTGDLVVTRITPTLQRILNTYKGFPNEQKEFNIDYNDIRNALPGLAKLAEIDQWEQVQTHTARRTRATLTILKNNDFEEARKLLGHATIKTTRLYFKASTQDVRSHLKFKE